MERLVKSINHVLDDGADNSAPSVPENGIERVFELGGAISARAARSIKLLVQPDVLPHLLPSRDQTVKITVPRH